MYERLLKRLESRWMGALGIVWILVIGGAIILTSRHLLWRIALGVWGGYGLVESLSLLLGKRSSWAQWLRPVRVAAICVFLGITFLLLLDEAPALAITLAVFLVVDAFIERRRRSQNARRSRGR
jgi:hypothetical protein